jgi:MFS family permease
MEQLLSIGRTQMALVFALATIVLTVGMNLAPYLFRRVPPALLLVASGIFGATGLAMAASAQGFVQLALGYGVLFGLGGGIAFIVVQQGVNQAMTVRSGLVNGYVVSLYPMGAMLGAPLFGWAIATQGLRTTLGLLALAVLGAALVAAWLFRRAGLVLHDAAPAATGDADPQWRLFARLFVVFLLAASAGLMVMSQAAGIVQAYGGQTALALAATTFITGAIAAARIGGGWLVDRFALPVVASGAHLWSLAGAALLTLWPDPKVSVAALAMIGMGYGIISGATAGGIAQYWHRNAFGLIASRMYIAWCAAAIVLPLLAGWLYDQTQGYGSAVLIAAGVNVVGAALAIGLPRRHTVAS